MRLELWDSWAKNDYMRVRRKTANFHRKKVRNTRLTAPIVGEAAGRGTLVIRVLVSGPSFKRLLGR